MEDKWPFAAGSKQIFTIFFSLFLFRCTWQLQYYQWTIWLLKAPILAFFWKVWRFECVNNATAIINIEFYNILHKIQNGVEISASYKAIRCVSH